MEIDFGFLALKIYRKSFFRAKHASLKDVKVVNDDHVEYLKSLSYSELLSRAESVSFSDLTDLSRIEYSLKENGIIIVPDFFGSDLMDKCGEIINELEESAKNFISADKRTEENDIILLQKGVEKISGYSALSSYGKTVMQIREGQDEGMIDVFNVDKAFPAAKELRSAYEKLGLQKILSSENLPISFRNLNFYINESITSTRGFHADSYSTQIKAFIYLTDCLSLEDGPYTYVKGTHRDSSYRRLNQEICSKLPNKTEAPLLNRDDIISVIAKKGSLVISDQSGFHRGFPQKEGRKRAISVINIK